MKNSRTIVIVLTVLLLAGGVAGGAWFAFRGGDPLKRAEQLAAAGNVRGAQIELRNAVRLHPDNPLAHLRLAQMQLQLADPVAAEKELKTARELGADRWAVTPDLGQAYMQQGRFKDVLAEVPPEGPKPDATAKNLMLRAAAQAGLNDLVAAKESLATAEKLSPGNAAVLVMAARVALETKDVATADEKATAALKVAPDDVDALLVKAQILVDQGDKKASFALIDKAVTLHPKSVTARLERANQLLNSGKDKQAQDDVDKILAEQPGNSGAIYLNGVLMVRAGRYADSQTELARLGQVAGRYPRALYFQALAAANLGQNEIAIDFANRYLARAPSDHDAARLVAQIEMTAQRPEQAVAVLLKSVGDGQGAGADSKSDAATLDMLGRAYAMMGRAPEAVATFKRAAAAAPDNPTILTHLASSEMQTGNATAATAALDRSVELAPGQANASEALVGAALSAGEIDKAEDALAKLRAKAGETEAVGILTGLVKLSRQDVEGGRVAFAATLKQFPDSIPAKLNLAKVLLLQGHRPESEALLREILQKQPANLEALNTLVAILVQGNQVPAALQVIDTAKAAAPKDVQLIVMQSDLLSRSGEARRAIDMLQDMRKSEELAPPLLFALARADAAAGQDDDALKVYRDILKATPGNLDARRAEVDLLVKQKDFDGARAALREALKESPGNLGIMSSMILMELRTTGFDPAMKVAEALRDDPGNLPNSTFLKGDLLMQSQRYPDAARAFEEEFKLRASTPLALRLANALASSGKDAEAASTLIAWQKQNPDDIDTAQYLGLLDVRAKRFDDAVRNLNIVLDKRSNDVVALNNLAWIYQQKNDPRARVLAQRAYLHAPTPETADTLGWIMVTQGDAKSGLGLLQQAVTQRPNDPTLKYHLAVAMKDTGQKDKAVELLKTITAAPESFDDKANARKLLDDLSSKP